MCSFLDILRMIEDEFKLDYEPMEGEIPDQDTKDRIRGTTQKTGKGRLCPVCQEKEEECCRKTGYRSYPKPDMTLYVV
jgi:hypothetical protein